MTLGSTRFPPPKDILEGNFDPYLWKLACRVYSDRISRAREEIASCEIDCSEIDALFEEALEQTDRGAAILIFSYAESAMHRALASHFTGIVKGGTAALFENNGPMGTASNRLMILAGLRWIDESTYRGLDVLRKMRNRFAHDVSIRSFEEDPIKGMVDSLPPFEKRFEKIPGLSGVFDVSNGMKKRHLFLARSALLLWNLVIESVEIPYSLKHLVGTHDVHDELANSSGNLRAASERFSHAMWLIIHSFAPDHFEQAKLLLEQAANAKKGGIDG